MASRPGILGTPLGQFGLGAVALVIGGALLFTLIGAVQGDADGDPAAAPGATEPTTDAPSTTTDAGTGTATDGATDPATDAPTGTDTPTDGATDAPTASETATSDAPAIDPASITIQVLNGSDDSADHDAVVGCLEGAGYDDLITSNRARTTYSTTAVFYTAGEDNQAAAQQVADALGIASVEEQPGNLSESVPVHVVTGQDGSGLC